MAMAEVETAGFDPAPSGVQTPVLCHLLHEMRSVTAVQLEIKEDIARLAASLRDAQVEVLAPSPAPPIVSKPPPPAAAGAAAGAVSLAAAEMPVASTLPMVPNPSGVSSGVPSRMSYPPAAVVEGDNGAPERQLSYDSDAGGRARQDTERNLDSESSHNVSSHRSAKALNWDSAGVVGGSGGNGALLPPNWPACITGRGWAERGGQTTGVVAQRLYREHGSTLEKNRRHSIIRTVTGPLSSTTRKFGALNPSSRFLLALDMFICIVLLYDLFVTPCSLAWNFPVEGITLLIACCAASFWTIDLVICFFTGYYHHGDIIRVQPKVAIHYLKTSFAFDALLLLVDWTVVFFHTFLHPGETNASGSLWLRYARTARMLKVLRIKRLAKQVNKLSAFVLSETMRFVVQTVQVTGGTLLVTHFIACFWVILGDEGQSDTGLRWMDVNGVDGRTMREFEPPFQYATAFHWAIAQLTLGANEVVVVNSVERAYNIFTLVLGLLYTSTLVSFFASQLMHFIILKQDIAVTVAKMKRYLRQHEVATAVAAHVCAQVIDKCSATPPLQEDDVLAIGLLSTSLRFELLRETRLPTLLTHKLFRTWEELSVDAVTALCVHVVKFTFLDMSDDLFLPLTASNQAYCVTRGTLTYSQSPEYANVRQATEQNVTEKEWIAEASLWSSWVHVGHMTAQTRSMLITVQTEGFDALLQSHAVIADLTCQYAAAFHQRLTQAMPPHAEYPNDLRVPFTESSELLSAHVGLGIIWKATRKGDLGLTKKELVKLEAEVRQEKCAVDERQDGSLRRTVFLTTVRVESVMDGRILTELGTLERNGEAVVHPKLPGLKRSRRETPKSALERCLSEEVGFLRESLAVETIEKRQEEHLSAHYGIRTTYQITEYHMTSSLDSNDCGLPYMCAQMTTSDRSLLDHPAFATHRGSGFRNQHEWETIVSQTVFVEQRGSKQVLFSWLTPRQLEIVKMPMNSANLETWLRSLSPADRLQGRSMVDPFLAEAPLNEEEEFDNQDDSFDVLHPPRKGNNALLPDQILLPSSSDLCILKLEAV